MGLFKSPGFSSILLPSQIILMLVSPNLFFSSDCKIEIFKLRAMQSNTHFKTRLMTQNLSYLSLYYTIHNSYWKAL